MIYIPLSRARTGMTLAKSISAPSGLYALLQRGEVLSPAIIERLNAHNIDGLYIEMEGSEDIEPTSVLRPEVKMEITSEFRSLYSDYFKRPFISSSSIESTKRVAGTIVDSVLNREDYLMDMMEIKSYDNYTYSHSLNVGVLSTMIASELELPRRRLEDLATCALMHDIGKIDVPIEIINKNGPITDSEFDIIKTHPKKGVERLRKCLTVSSEILPGIHCHHEKIDGSGYPYGYVGNQIPLFGRILAIADVYDALTSHRSYRKAWHPKEALEYIIAGSDSQFDCELVEIFMHLICAYPLGTIVKLSDGSNAIVMKNHPENVFRPSVKLLEDTPLGEKGTVIDLTEDIRYLHLTITAVFNSTEEGSFEIPFLQGDSQKKKE